MPMNARQRNSLYHLQRAATRSAVAIGPHQTGAQLILLGISYLNNMNGEVSDDMVRVIAEVGKELLDANPELLPH